jgi:flagellar protein FlgJ
MGPQAPCAHADGRSGAPSTSDAVTPQHAAQFVSAVLPTIRRAAASLGVSPLGLLAQAALETGWGKRMARTADGTPSLNMFGIKAGEGWTGARAVADTVEFSGGVATQRRTAFRAYGSIEASVDDFANLLSNSPRYRDAITAGANAQAYIQSIARSGYATDPDYGNKLSQILNGSTLRAALGTRTIEL